MQIDIQDIQRRLSTPDNYGQACNFLWLDKTHGIKLFRYKEQRDEALRNQRKLYKVGLAPKPYKRFDVPATVEHAFGYITEICPWLAVELVYFEAIAIHGFTADQVLDYYSLSIDDYEDFREICNKFEIDCEKIRDKIHAQTSLSFCDNHLWNWGYMYDGSVVCIDTEGMDGEY